MKYLVLIIILTILILCSCTLGPEGDRDFPTVEITYPPDNAEFHYGTVITITADAHDNIGVTKVDFDIDNGDSYADFAEPYEYEWYTGVLKDQQYTIFATAWDSTENYTVSEHIHITLHDSMFVTVLVPNGGENWQTGDFKTIIWEDNIHSNVMIELFESGSFYSTITSSTPSDSIFDYII